MPFSFFDIFGQPTTAAQVMRAAKAPRLPGPGMLGDMPAENIGEVGERPPVPPQAQPAMRPPMGGGAMDEAMFADAAPRLPPPPSMRSPAAALGESGEDVTAEAAKAALERYAPGSLPSPSGPSSGGGLPVQPASGTPAAQPGAMPRPPAPQADARTDPRADALREFRNKKRATMTAIAQKMVSEGSPAMRVQGVQMLFEVQKDYEAELAADEAKAKADQEKQTSLNLIETSTADEADKQRAKTLQALGARPQDVAEALRFNNAGAEERTKRREQFTRWGSTVSTAARDLGTIETQVAKAEELLKDGFATTGTKAWAAQLVPGSDANKLNAALDPIRALVGYGYLQEMREASKTGGAIGNVTENETRWLMGIQGGLDPVTSDPDSLRENMRTILEGKKIVLEMKKLAPALDAGDPAAWDKYADLTQQLAVNGQTVRQRIKAENDRREVAPEDTDIEGRY